MKRFLQSLMVAFLSLAMVGCFDVEGPVGPEAPDVGEITLSQDYLEVDANGGEYSVNIYTEYKNFQSTPNVDWIEIMGGNCGSEYCTLFFEVQPNPTNNAREGVITIFCDDYNLSATLTVHQYAGKASSDVTFNFSGEISDTSATLTAHPSDNTVRYYWDVFEAATVAYMGTVEFMYAYHTMIQDLLSANGSTWADVLYQGENTYTYEGLTPATEYVVFAYVVDAATGAILSKDLSYTTFITKESSSSTVDPSWFGTWELTSSKTYMQTTGADGKYSEAFYDSALTRTITIEDSGIGDGTVLVYGWDGYFLDSAPALAVIDNDTLHLVNDVVVYEDTEQGLVYQWIAQSSIPTYGESLYMLNGQYYAYNFMKNGDTLIGQNGSGTVTAGGVDHNFYVQAFTIFPVGGDKIYVWKYDAPAYTFAGESFKAVKVSGTRALSSTKLSSKKTNKFRMMHKFANARIAAYEFSSAVKFAK